MAGHISGELEKRGVTVKALRRRFEWQPGVPVPNDMLDYVQQSVDFTFEEGDRVAVRIETTTSHGGTPLPEYYIGHVLPWQSDESATELLRVYLIDEGGTAPVKRKHLELYKISSKPPAAYAGGGGQGSRSQLVAAAVGNGAAPSVGDDAAPSVGGGTAPSEPTMSLGRLIQQLRQMQSLPPREYKQAARRLWKQWHPDKCSDPCATQGTQLLNRHIETYEGNKDFSWLDDAAVMPQAEAGQSGAEQPGAEQPNEERPGGGQPHARPHTWFDEFEREEQEINDTAQRARCRQGEYPPPPPQHEYDGQNQYCSARSARRVDKDHSDLLWRQSAEEHESALVLAANGRHAHAVWHAQQACEMGLKSLLLRTCGILNEELGGMRAHDLAGFVAKANGHARGCPVPPLVDDLTRILNFGQL